MKRAIWISALAILALAACGKKTETTTTEASTISKAAPPAGGAAPPTTSAAPPERKPGLWEQTMSSDRISQTTRICLDKSVENKLSWTGQQVGTSGCEKATVTPRIGGGWEFNSICELGAGGRVVSHGVASGDFGDRYSVEIDSTTTGASMPQANGDHKMKLEASWKGPCPADMKPGDMELPGGMRLNMADAMAGAGHRPSPADMARMRAQAMEMAKSQHQ